jgi:hypothetical protein
MLVLNLRSITSVAMLLALTSLVAQETTKPVAPQESAPTTVTPKQLHDGELAISGRYERFERMLSQMADILGRQDPERADLLRRAIGKGREDQVKENIKSAIELLEKEDLGAATEKQSEVVASLGTLLKLLQSEDRRSSVERERERLNGLLKDVRSVLAEQKSTRAATRSAEAPSSAAKGQQKALSEADKLLQSMKEHDDQESKSTSGEGSEQPEEKDPSESNSPKDEEPQDGDSKDGKQTDDPNKGSKDGKSSDPQGDEKSSKSGKSESKDGKANGKDSPRNPKGPDQQGKPSKSESGSKSKSGGQSKGSQSKGGQKEQKQTPGREELQKAQEQMEQALEELKAQEREKALEKEDEAIEELHKAAAELEEMLKQLREEEKEMLLASLEARFQRMLAAQTQIHEGTLTLAATPQEDWLNQYYGQCRVLAQQQSDLATECSQTVNLLREDGTSVSILMAVEDIEADMGSVTGWLQESKVGELTQTLQKDIIESLKQLIDTTQKEMQEMKEQQQQQQQQNNAEQKQGLVDFMAEIRMLRNLQLQVNRRTKQVNTLLQSSASDDLPALNKQIRDLAVRQRRLIESAKELASQSN